MKNYKREFIDCNGNVIIHTWDSPYPKKFLSEENKITESEKEKENNNYEKDIKEEERIKKEEMKKKRRIKIK